MADKSLTSVNIDSMEEALHRLSKKPGVKAWLMLDRSNGAVLKTNGQIAAVRPAKASSSANNTGVSPSLPTPTSGSFSTDVHTNTNNESLAAQELASMVWSLLGSAGTLVDETDSEDELKLLRLRTKRQEFVIVPEPKYLLVVIHDTPPA
ncbi:putative dynein light chain roadblock-type 1 [Rosellinia necatrix]|uniref:Putative dynein light chain roadblock-type 1 n=1 Tax=Rosellinia necatrix TaxID=77044 RepID=A0A1W2TGN1_ROSNE|nr:putative dynein light chain roadblock-type 1 [Rosellinia necatrix]